MHYEDKMHVVVMTVLLLSVQRTFGSAIPASSDINFGRNTNLTSATTPTNLPAAETTDISHPTKDPPLSTETPMACMAGACGNNCLKCTYNGTKHDFGSKDYIYDIRFMALSPVATINLNFDFSTTGLSPPLFSHPVRHSVSSHTWHKLRVFHSEYTKDCENAQVSIDGKVRDCLPHKTVSSILISSDGDSFIIWNTCPEQSTGRWFDELTKNPTETSTSGIIHLWVCVVLGAVVIALTIYSCCLHYLLKKERSKELKQEPVYAEWNDQRSASPVSSGKYSDECTVKTSLSCSSNGRFT